MGLLRGWWTVDQTHLELSSGQLALQKICLFFVLFFISGAIEQPQL